MSRHPLPLLGAAALWATLACGGAGKDASDDTDDSGKADGPGASACVGIGFEATPTPWALPSGYADGTFHEAWDASTSSPNWALVDLDGDGADELVFTEDSAADATVGTSAWLVYANDGDGFAGTPTRWALPSGYPDGAFALDYDSSTSSPNWALLDLDGDGAPELVVTLDAAADADLGTGSWLVYANTGSGFAGTGTRWALPSGYAAGTFKATADGSTSSPNWGLRDLDGDARPELVIARDDDADAAIGSSYWSVYSNTGAGFAGAPTHWDLPAGYPDHTFDVVADDDSTAPAWSLLDLDGDGLVELVITSDDADGTLGNSRWLVYPNAGDGFESAVASWALPGGYPDGLFARSYDTSTSSPNWTLVDIDQDGALDIVVTLDASADPSLGTSSWLVWRGGHDGVATDPDSWDLPGGYSDGLFNVTYDTSTSSPNWALFDLDGPDALDLVITQDTAGSDAIGASKWQFYRGVCE